MRTYGSGSLAVLLGLGAVVCAAPAATHAQAFIGIAVGFAPPALPVYEQPPCPGYGYIWTPGYWAWDNYDEDYYWVPGTWVEPPRIGFLWTPGYWAWQDGVYEFNTGYWDRSVGYYGGIDYGFGYTGDSYGGNYWQGNTLYYNTYVNNISNTNITTVYNRTVINNTTINNTTINNVSYNGGAHGAHVQPTAQQIALVRQNHLPPTAAQIQHQHVASANRALLASVNHGKPPIAATVRPAVLHGPGIVAAARAPIYRRPANAVALNRNAAAIVAARRPGQSATAARGGPAARSGPAGVMAAPPGARPAPVVVRTRAPAAGRPLAAHTVVGPTHHGPTNQPARTFATARAQAHAPVHGQASAPVHGANYRPVHAQIRAQPHALAHASAAARPQHHAPAHAYAPGHTNAPPRPQYRAPPHAFAPPRPQYRGPAHASAPPHPQYHAPARAYAPPRPQYHAPVHASAPPRPAFHAPPPQVHAAPPRAAPPRATATPRQRPN